MTEQTQRKSRYDSGVTEIATVEPLRGCTPKSILSGGIPCLLAYTSNYVGIQKAARTEKRGNCTRYGRDHSHLSTHRVHLIVSAWSPDWSTLPDIYWNKFCHRANVTAATFHWFQQMEPPHIYFCSESLDAVWERWIGVEVQCIDFSDRQTFPAGLFLLGANEIVVYETQTAPRNL
ncbi:hypothetical protein TNCV_1027571 [Trichonephila clavipes]|nr:hypothetical protein TNCV_1027571 [Trichonephila clavipes]